jgi:transposase, IS5 family
VTPGRRMRVDTTVVETNIHYPTDSTLLGDGVRVGLFSEYSLRALSGNKTCATCTAVRNPRTREKRSPSRRRKCVTSYPL